MNRRNTPGKATLRGPTEEVERVQATPAAAAEVDAEEAGGVRAVAWKMALLD